MARRREQRVEHEDQPIELERFLPTEWASLEELQRDGVLAEVRAWRRWQRAVERERDGRDEH
jgi:hypothetical protein